MFIGKTFGLPLQAKIIIFSPTPIESVVNLDLVFEVLYALGWSEERASFAVTYAMVGVEKLDNGQTSITST